MKTEAMAHSTAGGNFEGLTLFAAEKNTTENWGNLLPYNSVAQMSMKEENGDLQ